MSILNDNTAWHILDKINWALLLLASNVNIIIDKYES